MGLLIWAWLKIQEQELVTQVLVFGSIYQGAILVHRATAVRDQKLETVGLARRTCTFESAKWVWLGF